MKKYLITLLLVAVLAGQAGATDRTWDGPAGGDWFTAANWDPNGSPASSDDLTINSGSTTTSSTVYSWNGGSITFNNSDTTGTFLSSLSIGHSGIGTLDIKNGAEVTSHNSSVGFGSGSTGTATIDGSGSTWNTGTFALNVGYYGTGMLNITNDADVTSGDGYIGDSAGSEGTVTVDGTGSTWLIGNGSGDLRVGFNGVATLNVKNYAQVTAGTLNIGAKGTVNLSGGKISAATLSGQVDSLNFTGGEFEITNDDVDISGTSPLGSYLSLTSGQILDVQNGTTTVASGSALSVNNGKVYGDELQNDGDLSIYNGGLVTTTNGLTNSSSMNLVGGTITGGIVINDYGANFNAGGTVNSALDNYGTIGLNDILTVADAMQNYGSVSISSSEMLRQNGGLDNYGTINLSGGSITGSGTVINHPGGIIHGGSAIGSQITNDGGLIHAHGSSTLLISNMSGNLNGGEMRVDDGAGINVLTPLSNAGTIVLNGSNATFSGGTVTNTGTILGQGRVSNSVNNDGIIRASGGTLTLAGSGFTNHSTGRIEVLEDSTIFVTQGLASNAGTINLQGGSFDNANHTLTNASKDSSITGFGTIRTGGLTNNNHIGVGIGDLDVIGPFTNNGSCDIQSGSTAVFFDDVTGSGSFGGTGTAMFLGALSPGSSPGIISFQTNVTLGSGSKLIMELGGLVRGGEYDALNVAGDFSLDGILDIELINDFLPHYGNIFDILDFDQNNLFGAFDTIDLPMLSAGLTWDTSSMYSVGEISVVPEPATICLLGLGSLLLTRNRKFNKK